MLRTFRPQINEFLSFPNHVLVQAKSGHGLIEVDFKAYEAIDDRLIFLSPEQPVKSASFYADQMHMSIQTLSRKVKDKLNRSAGDLIRLEIIHTAKKLLLQLPIKETAFE